MNGVVNILQANPVLLLAVVLGVGYTVGSVRFRGVSLGVSGVFFAGLAASAFDEHLRLPDFVDQFGLVLFVYITGLVGGPAFFRALRSHGVRANGLTVGVLAFAGALTALLAHAFHLNGATAAGTFAGANVNVPALAGALDTLAHHGEAARGVDAVVGMSLTYPVGVLATVLATALYLRLARPDFAAEAHDNADLAPTGDAIVGLTVLVTTPGGAIPADALQDIKDTVVISRVEHNGVVHVGALADERLDVGDRVHVVGTAAAVRVVADRLGRETTRGLTFDRGEVDRRRIIVTNPALAGVRLDALNLGSRYGAIVTRVRRGDNDILADGSLHLALGDRVRVVAPRAQITALTAVFGDSEVALGRLDLRTLTLGIAAGLLLGLIPLPLPGGVVLRLGLAGGPIISGLVLGALGRTGSFTWQLPRPASQVLRQLGIVLFFAGVGLKTGHAFAAAVAGGHGLLILGAGTAVATGVALVAVLTGHYLLHIPGSLLVGVLAGMGTNPAALTYAEEHVPNELPTIGYALVFPVAMVAKVLVGEVLVQLLR